MEINGTPNTLNAPMQSSIRSFFQPRHSTDSAPPSAVSAQKAGNMASTSTDSQVLKRVSLECKDARKYFSYPEYASISRITPEHIQPLRRINTLLLPVSYPDSFYHKILSLDTPMSFSRCIIWSDPDPKVIGGVVCRLDPALHPESTPQSPKYVEGSYDIYIQSLALLSPYRGKGLVAKVLNEIIQAATTQKELRILSLLAHVWTENTDALDWYAARGFQRNEKVIQGYYRRLKPDSAWILRRGITPSDYLQIPAQVEAPSADTIMGESRTTLPPIAVRSFQDKGPEREWNDLPEDVIANQLLKAENRQASQTARGNSSRSSSRNETETGRAKKRRVYPAAAFYS